MNPMVLYLIDVWLENASYDLMKRGKLFEVYLADYLNTSLTNKGYFARVFHSVNVSLSKKSLEEVDIILELKDSIILIEAKCIKYPFSSRERSNAYGRLLKAGKQIQRKKATFLKNRASLESFQNSQDKRVETLIVTNFAFMSGLNFFGTAVVDMFFLESYIGHGKLTRINPFAPKNEEGLDHPEMIYYRNEDEFCENFIETMITPPPITEILNQLEMKIARKSSENYTDFQFYEYEPSFK